MIDRDGSVSSEIDRMLDDARAAADTLASNLRGGASSLQGELDSIRGELAGVREGRLETGGSDGGGRGRGGDMSTAAAMASEPASVEPEEIEDDGPVDAEPEIIDEVEETTVDAGANGDSGVAAMDEEEEEATAEELEAEVAEEEHAPQPSSGGRSIRGAEGARLIALNMALNGTPRDETARYLSQNFDLAD